MKQFDIYPQLPQVMGESGTSPDHPAVSVVLPCYNYVDMVGDAIRSVQEQTLEDWELIVVDDGSTDNSVSVISEFVQKDDRIRLVQHRNNLRLPSARNTGFSHAKGDYVCLLDADDLYLPHKLGQQVAFMRANPLTTLGYNDFMCDGGRSNAAEYDYDALCQECYIPCQSVIIDQTILSLAGGNDRSLNHAEDWDHWIWLATIAGPFHKINEEPAYQLRFHDRQRTRDFEGLKQAQEEVKGRAVVYRSTMKHPIRILHIMDHMARQGAQMVLWHILEHLDRPPFIHHLAYQHTGELLDDIRKQHPSVVCMPLGAAQPNNYDIIHVHFWGPTYVEVNEFVEKGSPFSTVVSEHSDCSPEHTTPTARLVATYHKYNPPQMTDGSYLPTHVNIPNGIPLNPGINCKTIDRAAVRQEFDLDGRPIILTVSKFGHIKGPDTFFKMCAILARRFPGRFNYVFVGGRHDDPQLYECMQLAETVKAAGESLSVIPPVSHEKVLSLMAAANLFVLTSRTETASLVSMEALSVGLPCVVPAIGGLPQLVGRGEWLVPSNAPPDDFAHAVAASLDSERNVALPERYADYLMARRYEVLYRAQALRRRLLGAG